MPRANLGVFVAQAKSAHAQLVLGPCGRMPCARSGHGGPDLLLPGQAQNSGKSDPGCLWVCVCVCVMARMTKCRNLHGGKLNSLCWGCVREAKLSRSLGFPHARRNHLEPKVVLTGAGREGRSAGGNWRLRGSQGATMLASNESSPPYRRQQNVWHHNNRDLAQF